MQGKTIYIFCAYRHILKGKKERRLKYVKTLSRGKTNYIIYNDTDVYSKEIKTEDQKFLAVLARGWFHTRSSQRGEPLVNSLHRVPEIPKEESG